MQQVPSFPFILLQSQSLRVEVDFENAKLLCLSSYELTIQYSQSELEQIDISNRMDFILYAKQLDITNIKFIPLQDYFQMTDTKFLTNVKQAQAFKYQKPLKNPCSYIALNYQLNHIRDDTQKVVISIKFEPAKLPQDPQEQLKFLRSLESQLLFKVQIEYVVNQPISGLRFIINKSQDKIRKYLITEKHLHNSRNWMPVPAFSQQQFPSNSCQAKDLIYFKKLIIIADALNYSICTGQLIEEKQIVEGNQRAMIYSICQYINPDDLGVFVGQFQNLQIDINDAKLMVFHSKQYKAYHFETEPIKKIFDDLDRYWFKDALLQKIRDRFDISNGQQFLSKLSIVILPGIYQDQYLSFYPFQNLLIFDECQIPSCIPCIKQLDEFHQCLELQLNCLILKLFLAPSSYFGHRWIEIGFTFLATTRNTDYNQLNEILLKQIRRGQDVKLEQSQDFEQRFELESQEYQNKTRIVMTILSRMTYQPDKLIKQILNRFYQDYQGTIPAPLMTDNLLEMTKKVFSLTNCKQISKLYINSIGGWHIKVSYDQKCENKLPLNITQYPLIGPWANLYTHHYLLGQRHMHLKNQTTQSFNEQHETLSKLKHQIQSQLKEFDDQYRDSSNRPKISVHSIKDFKRRNYQIQAQALVPVQLKALMHFSGKVTVTISQTNELQMNIVNEKIKIPQKLWSKVEITKTQNELKKTNISKRQIEINQQQYIEKGEGDQGLFDQQENKTISATIVRGILEEAVLQAGCQLEKVKELSEQIQREPPLWIKWDPDGLMIKDIEFQMQNESLIVKSQILKEKDLNQIVCTLRSVKKPELRENCIKLIINIIEAAYAFLESSVLVQLLQLLRELVNKNSIKQRKETQMEQEDNGDEKMQDDLYLYLKLVEKIVYRFFYNQNDNTLKYLKFNNVNEYQVILAVFWNLGKLEFLSSQGLHLELMRLLIDILSSYDNSYNQFDCSELIGKLVKLLLKCKCGQFKYSVLKTILHELKKVVFNTDQRNYILKSIIIYYDTFVEINYDNTDEEPFKSINDEILDILRLHQFQILPREENSFIEMAYYKIKLLDQFEEIDNVYYFVLKQFQHITKIRLNRGYTSIIFNHYLRKLRNFMVKHYQEFAKQLSNPEIKEELATVLAYTAFEQIITGPSLLNYAIQHNFISIYKILYYYFAPLHYQKEIETRNPDLFCTLSRFPPDSNWCDESLKQLSSELSDFQTITQNQVAKKSRPSQDFIQSLQRIAEKYPDKVTDSFINKQILKHIKTLSIIRVIEDKEGGELSPRSSHYSKIDEILNGMKRKNLSMEAVQNISLQYLRYHQERKNVDQEQYRELQSMFQNLFNDGKTVLEAFKEKRAQRKSEKQSQKFEQILSNQFQLLDQQGMEFKATFKLGQEQ